MVPDYTNLSKTFFTDHSKEYDLAEAAECGRYTEAFVKFARGVDPKIGHLIKHGGTQYNGHAIDAVLYPVGGGVYHSVDIIGSAEQPHPWNSEGGSNHPDPSGQWSEYPDHAYTAADWTAEPVSNPGVKMVPYVPYNENGFQRLKNMLAHDYARRPQGADFDVSIWSARFFHNHYMGPEGTPLSEQVALERVKAELCPALHIPLSCDGTNCLHTPGTVYYG